jgi:preprotein translocase subunit SecG
MLCYQRFTRLLKVEMTFSTILEQNLWTFIALFFILLFALGIFWINRYKVDQLSRKKQRALSLGFKPIEKLNNNVLDQLNQIFPQEHTLDIQNLFVQSRMDVEYYLMDINAKDESEASNLGEDVLVIHSSYLSLPYFVMFPFLNFDNRLAFLANQMISGLVDKIGNRNKLKRIEFGEFPYIDDRFIILGEDQNNIRNFFTSSHMQGFFKINPKYEIFARDNTIVMKIIFPDPKSRREQILRNQFEDAEAVFKYFSQ